VTIFKEDMMIWQYGDYQNDIHEYLAYVEGLLDEWNELQIDLDVYLSEPSSFFRSEFEFKVATFLLHDGLLPHKIQKIMAYAIMNSRLDLESRNIKFDILKVSKKAKVGRPKDKSLLTRDSEVLYFLELGLSKTEAYKQVASKHFKSPDTIRRGFEKNTRASIGLREKLSNIYSRNKK
jgi:hypothetical protein